jgi:glycosyltransferase involved in cell wall biosynthesis
MMQCGAIRSQSTGSIFACRLPSIELGVFASSVLAGFPVPLRSGIAVLPTLLSHTDYAEHHLDYDIFLLPSFFEGTLLALIEAMCTGIPVVTTATCGMKDVVENGRNGLLVAAGNCGEIVRLIESLMNDLSLGRRLGEQAGKMLPGSTPGERQQSLPMRRIPVC